MTATTTRWAELLPREFLARQQQLPLVYLPLGLCEPHGHAAAFGLDTLKAEWLCEEAARRFGGIVAPTQGYQIHETGYHRPWLAEVVGDVNPHLGQRAAGRAAADAAVPGARLRQRRLPRRRRAHRASRQRGRPAPRRHRGDAHPAGADHRRRRPGAGPAATTPAITQAASRSRSSCTSGPTSSTSPGSATPPPARWAGSPRAPTPARPPRSRAATSSNTASPGCTTSSTSTSRSPNRSRH